jgi:hypothetical protein
MTIPVWYIDEDTPEQVTITVSKVDLFEIASAIELWRELAQEALDDGDCEQDHVDRLLRLEGLFNDISGKGSIIEAIKGAVT